MVFRTCSGANLKPRNLFVAISVGRSRVKYYPRNDRGDPAVVVGGACYMTDIISGNLSHESYQGILLSVTEPLGL